MLSLILASLSLAAPSTPVDADQAPLNVLVLTLDALRPDRMALYGHDRPTTPYLDRFASESVVFDAAFATGAWTSPGIVSIFTGLHPPAHGQGSRYDYVDDQLITPLDVLRSHGLRAIARDTGGPTIRGLGFQHAYAPALKDGVDILDWLIKGGDGWIAWVHLKPNHLPYDPTPFHLRRFGGDRLDSPALQAIRSSGTVYPQDYGLSWNPPVIPSFTVEEQAVTRDLYDGTVADADAMVGRMIERLRETGRLDRTIVILTADHGEELFDHGWVGHASTGYEGKVYDELIRVPLIVRLPGGVHAGRVPDLVQHSDLMPTLFELLEIDASRVDGGMQGRSLLPLIHGEGDGHAHIFARTTFKGWTCPLDESRDGATAVRTADRKLIRVRRDGEIHHEAFDLEADPSEQRDLYASDPERFADLVERLDRYDAEGADHAAGLMFTAANRHLTALGAAAEQRDAVEAARIWTALNELERTFSNEWVRALDQRTYANQWSRLMRKAATLRDRASR